MPPGSRFCPSCGRRVAAATDAPRDRRIVSVVFADIVGSVALGRRLDSEAFTALLGRALEVMTDAVELHGGRVDRFAGDAVLAIFGAPVLHDDDALRAVHAAVDMRSRIAGLDVEMVETYGESLSLRIGVNTGEATVRSGASGQLTVVGDAVNLAARLEQAAPPGDIYVGEATRLLLGQAVRLETLEPLHVKGSDHPVTAHRVVGIAEPTHRILTGPTVGRDAEIATITARVQRCVDDRSPAVMAVVGEAGIGKSRLVTEVAARLGARAHVVRGRCLPYGRGLSFWPLRELILDLLGPADDGRDEPAVERLAALLGHEATSVAAGIEGLLGADGAVGGRHEISFAVRRVLLEVAREKPVVAVIDDLQWAEPVLLEVLEYIAAPAGDAPLLVLTAGRPEAVEAHGPWLQRVAVETVTLRTLSEGDAVELLHAVGGMTGWSARKPVASLLRPAATRSSSRSWCARCATARPTWLPRPRRCRCCWRHVSPPSRRSHDRR